MCTKLMELINLNYFGGTDEPIFTIKNQRDLPITLDKKEKGNSQKKKIVSLVFNQSFGN